MSGYDHWKINGRQHLCVCGQVWYDADGGPCHRRCECGAIIDADGDLCPACIIYKAKWGEL